MQVFCRSLQRKHGICTPMALPSKPCSEQDAFQSHSDSHLSRDDQWPSTHCWSSAGIAMCCGSPLSVCTWLWQLVYMLADVIEIWYCLVRDQRLQTGSTVVYVWLLIVML